MRTIEPMEVGLVFWAEQSPESHLRELDSFGISSAQLGIPPSLNCETALDDWKTCLDLADVSITSVACSYSGEDYSSLKTIHETVGFTAERYRSERIARTKAVSAFAGALGLNGLSCHLGFIPSDPSAILYKELCDLTRLICDSCGERNQNFVLETGQESADTLLQFIRSVDRSNLKVNFDPANMVIYQSGEPVAALRALGDFVISVHCKDAFSPAGTNLLGVECAIGDGDVDFPNFLQTLQQIGYQGALNIEREEPVRGKRIADIHTGIARLKEWKSARGL